MSCPLWSPQLVTMTFLEARISGFGTVPSSRFWGPVARMQKGLLLCDDGAAAAAAQGRVDTVPPSGCRDWRVRRRRRVEYALLCSMPWRRLVEAARGSYVKLRRSRPTVSTVHAAVESWSETLSSRSRPPRPHSPAWLPSPFYLDCFAARQICKCRAGHSRVSSSSTLGRPHASNS